jgi:hypothetical protein
LQNRSSDVARTIVLVSRRIVANESESHAASASIVSHGSTSDPPMQVDINEGDRSRCNYPDVNIFNVRAYGLPLRPRTHLRGHSAPGSVSVRQ